MITPTTDDIAARRQARVISVAPTTHPYEGMTGPVIGWNGIHVTVLITFTTETLTGPNMLPVSVSKPVPCLFAPDGLEWAADHD